MFQKEVAERIVAQSRVQGLWAAGDPGAVALRCADRHDPAARRLHPAAKGKFGRGASSALPAPRFEADPKVLERVVAAAFNQRRKMLRASLKGLSPAIEDHLAAGHSRPPSGRNGVSAGRVLRAGTQPGHPLKPSSTRRRRRGSDPPGLVVGFLASGFLRGLRGARGRFGFSAAWASGGLADKTGADSACSPGPIACSVDHIAGCGLADGSSGCPAWTRSRCGCGLSDFARVLIGPRCTVAVTLGWRSRFSRSCCSRRASCSRCASLSMRR